MSRNYQCFNVQSKCVWLRVCVHTWTSQIGLDHPVTGIVTTKTRSDMARSFCPTLCLRFWFFWKENCGVKSPIDICRHIHGVVPSEETTPNIFGIILVMIFYFFKCIQVSYYIYLNIYILFVFSVSPFCNCGSDSISKLRTGLMLQYALNACQMCQLVRVSDGVCFGLGAVFVEVPRHECAGVCSMMVGLPCQGVIPLLNNVFRGGCGTLYEKAWRCTLCVTEVSWST